ncbi:hypothetical protein B0H11DRAFT_1920268 [Mycena galericulata]|nr:hypothetical protein B0H11DRAFT_1920268 [Mycena galericulata]
MFIAYLSHTNDSKRVFATRRKGLGTRKRAGSSHNSQRLPRMDDLTGRHVSGYQSQLVVLMDSFSLRNWGPFKFPALGAAASGGVSADLSEIRVSAYSSAQPQNKLRENIQFQMILPVALVDLQGAAELVCTRWRQDQWDLAETREKSSQHTQNYPCIVPAQEITPHFKLTRCKIKHEGKNVRGQNAWQGGSASQTLTYNIQLYGTAAESRDLQEGSFTNSFNHHTCAYLCADATNWRELMVSEGIARQSVRFGGQCSSRNCARSKLGDQDGHAEASAWPELIGYTLPSDGILWQGLTSLIQLYDR